MCSISWQTHPQGYDLFFNRDEQRDRPTADPPERFRDSAGVAYLAPIDPRGGGTWIFLNAHGLTAAVMNAYEVDDSPGLKDPASRGQLLRSLSHSADVSTFEAELSIRLGRDTYPPCYLFALDRQHTTGLWLWTGASLKTRPIPALNFFTTSGLQPDAVRARREQAFKQTVGEPPHDPDARSVSYTRVRLRENSGTMDYAPRSGDEVFPKITEKNYRRGLLKTALIG